MAERSPIFSTKIDNQRIGYIEGRGAFDLLGNKRCNYNQSTGNLLELDSGRTIGHVSLAGYFVGSSWIADELFPQPVAKGSPTASLDKPCVADYPGTADAPSKGASAGLATSPDEAVTVECTALVISLAEAVAAAPISSTASSDGPTAAAPAMSFEAFSQEPTAVEPAASLTTSIEGTAAACYAADAPPRDKAVSAQQAEILPPIDIERQVLEMVQMTLAMKSVKPKPQSVKVVAMRMREHLAGLRRQRPRARMVKKADLMQIREGHARD
jgi:hypothetical protein